MSPNARTLLAAAVAAAMMALTTHLFAAEPAAPAPVYKREPIYGYRLMSDPERDDYRKRMREARSEQERQAIRDGHRKQMEARAKERGVTLPEPRGPRGPGTGPGPRAGGPGPGYGPGSGMGPGSGPRWQGEGGPGFGKGKGYGPGGKGPGYGPAGKGPGYGPGARGDCPAGQDCPGPGAGKGPGYGAGPRP